MIKRRRNNITSNVDVARLDSASRHLWLDTSSLLTFSTAFRNIAKRTLVYRTCYSKQVRWIILLILLKKALHKFVKRLNMSSQDTGHSSLILSGPVLSSFAQ